MKNEYEVLGDTAVIFIKRRNGVVFNTFIDTSDLDKVMSYKGSWYVNYNKHTESYYVVGNIKGPDGKQTLVGLHRFILEPSPENHIDHFDRNTLNNKRKNLREVTLAQNNQNKGVQKNNKSGVRGVYWCKHRKKWRATVKQAGKVHYFGYHTTVESAEKAVKKGRKKLLPYAN